MDDRRPVQSDPGDAADCVQALVRTVAEVLQNRGALLAIEIREEMHARSVQLLLLWLAATLLHLAAISLSVVVLVAYWDENRLAAALWLFAAYLCAAVVAIVVLRSRRGGMRDRFALSLIELKRDAVALGIVR